MSEVLGQALAAQAPAESAAPAEGDIMVIAPGERRVYKVPAANIAQYEKRGFQRYSGPTIDDDGISATMQQWGQATRAAGLAALNNLPFASYGIEKLAPADTARDYAQSVAEAKRDHPYAYGAGAVAGNVAGILPVARAVGLAGRGVGAVAEALTYSETEAMALGKTAERLGRLAGGIGEGASFGAVQSASDQLGDEAMAEAFTPEGHEKLAFSFRRLAMDAAVGGVAGGVFKAGAMGVAKLGRGLDSGGKTLLRRSILGAEAEKNLKQQATLSGQWAEDSDIAPATIRLADELALARQNGMSAENELVGRIKSSGTIMADLEERAPSKVFGVDAAKQVLSETASLDSAVLQRELQPLRDHVRHQEYIQGIRGKLEKGMFTNSQAEAAIAEYEGRHPPMSIAQAKELYDKIYKLIDYKNPKRNELYQAFQRGGKALSNAVSDHVEKQLGKEAGAAYRNAKREYNVAATLASALNKSQGATVAGLANQSLSAAASNAFFALAGAKSMGVFAAAGQGAAFSITGQASRAAGPLGRGMSAIGSHLRTADDHLVGAVKAGLYSVAPSVNDFRHDGDYDKWATTALAAKANPVETFEAIFNGLSGQGLHDTVAHHVSMKQVAQLQDMGKMIPPRQGPADVPSKTRPDPVAQRKWMAQARSMQDPYYALRFPTASNMAAAKQYSPQTIAKAQQVIMDQIVKNPDLPAASRFYAARVLGRPIGPSTDPKFYQMIMQLREQAEQQEAASGANTSRRPSSGAGGGVPSETTRLGELAAP